MQLVTLKRTTTLGMDNTQHMYTMKEAEMMLANTIKHGVLKVANANKHLS
jgi:hypothetical protein